MRMTFFQILFLEKMNVFENYWRFSVRMAFQIIPYMVSVEYCVSLLTVAVGQLDWLQ